MSDLKANRLPDPDAIELLLRAHDGDCALLYLWELRRGALNSDAAALELCMTASQISAAEEKLQRMGLSFSVGPQQPSPMDSDAAAPQLSASATPASPSVSQLAPAAVASGFATSQPSMPATVDTAPAFPASSSPVPLQQGLSDPPVQNLIAPADELPSYSAADIDACDRSDPAFHAVLERAQSVIGKTLTRADTGLLLGIYRHLGLPAEVIFVLLQSCLDAVSDSGSSARRPTGYAIEREAYVWVHQGILTMEAAEEYAEKQKLYHASVGRIRKILEIYDRNLTKAEKEYISSWLSFGFEDALIAAAYEKTVNNTGKRALAYMDKILRRWKEAGIYSISDLREKEPASSASHAVKGNVRSPFQPTEFDDSPSLSSTRSGVADSRAPDLSSHSAPSGASSARSPFRPTDFDAEV